MTTILSSKCAHCGSTERIVMEERVPVVPAPPAPDEPQIEMIREGGDDGIELSPLAIVVVCLIAAFGPLYAFKAVCWAIEVIPAMFHAPRFGE